MKLTNFAIIFIIIITPYMLYNHYDSRQEIITSYQKRSYDNIIEKAISDATIALYMDTTVDENNRIILNKEFAIDTFFETLAINFGYMDDMEIEYIKSYVPMIIIIDYDGVYTYSVEKYIEPSSGENVLKHVLHDKKYFTITEGDDIITMYLDGSFKVLSTSKNRSFYGTYDELKSISLNSFFNQTEAEIERIRKEMVNDVILNEMQRMNLHNEFANINGVNYDFYIPAVEDDMKTSTINNIGFIASLQGFPTGGERYNKFSISINSIEKAQKIYGYNDAGRLIYHEEGCPSMTGTLQEIFESKKEAARNGYYPDYDCN